MATFTTNLTSTTVTTAPASRPNGEIVTGHHLFAEATYICVGTEVATDIIDIVKLPIGAVVQAARCRVSSEACGGTTGTIASIGDGITAARYSATAIGITSAASALVTPVIANEVAKYATVRATATTVETQTIKATIGLASGSFTAGKKVVFEIAYRQL